MRFQRRISRPLGWAGLMATVLLIGCGPSLYPAGGTVTYEDGIPVPGDGTVVFEGTVGGRLEMARGAIGPDGRFQLSTLKPGDGAYAGTYHVKLVPAPSDPDQPTRSPKYHPRYTEFETSGLEFEVKPGANEFPITVSRPSKK